MADPAKKSPPPDPKDPASPGEKKGRRPRARYTRETYDRMLAGYRGSPGNHSQASRYAQVDRAMCRLAWERGFPRQYKAGAVWARPIKEVLAEEVEAARVKRAEEARRERERQDAEREAARRESVEELAEEGRLRGVLRKDLLASALVLSELVPSVRALAGVVRSAVLDPQGKPLATPGVSPMQAMKLLKEYGATVSRVAYAGETIVQLGRTVRGQANVNVAVHDMSHEEALEELEMAAEVLQAAKKIRGGEPAEEEEEDGEPAPVH